MKDQQALTRAGADGRMQIHHGENHQLFLALPTEAQVALFQASHVWHAAEMAYPKEELEAHLAGNGPLSPAVLATIANLLSTGMSQTTTARAVGIPKAQWERYYRLAATGEYPYALLGRIIDLTGAAVEERLVRTWMTAATDGFGGKDPDWRAAQALLGVKNREDYSPSNKTQLTVGAAGEEEPQPESQLTPEGLLEVARILEASGALRAGIVPEPETLDGEVVTDDTAERE